MLAAFDDCTEAGGGDGGSTKRVSSCQQNSVWWGQVGGTAAILSRDTGAVADRTKG